MAAPQLDLDRRATGVAPRRRLTRKRAFWLTGALLGLFLVASTAPSPMYAIYQQRWGFSATVLTEVFAAYMIGILAALVLLGGSSDRIGRRPVLAAALVLQIISMAVLAAAPEVSWLFLGRLLQGIATGTATSAISGALLDFQPAGTNRGATLNAVAAGAGMAVGSGAAGALVQYAPAPTVLSYLLLIAAFGISLLLVRAMPEPVQVDRVPLHEALRPQRPTVPQGRGRAFALLATTMLATWSVGGVFMSLGPSIAKGLVSGDPYLVGGLSVATVTGVGAITQLLLSGWSGQRSVRVGSSLLVLGLAGVAASVLGGGAIAFFGGAGVLGIGWGLVFMGGFRLLSALADPHNRAGMASSIYVVAYLSSALPSVCLGALTTVVGLPNSTVIFSAVAAAFAVLAFTSTFARR